MLHKRRGEFCGVSDLVLRADAMMHAVGDVPDRVDGEIPLELEGPLSQL
jgi:hypothetical protein